MKSLVNYIDERQNIRLNEYISEVQKRFVDPDTGEVVMVDVQEIDAEREAEIQAKAAENARKFDDSCKKERELLKQLEKVENEQWQYQEELADLRREYRSLHIDMEDELGQLYSSGNEAEAEQKAQEYGERFNEIEDLVDEFKKKIEDLQPRIDDLRNQRNKIWDWVS